MLDRRQFLARMAIMTVASNVVAGAKGPVVVSAGRRVDAPDTSSPRFPASNVDSVRKKVREFFAHESPGAVVCSAACGSDLLVLEAAAAKNVQRYVLLGAEPAVFRKESVTDRPGNWGEMFDEVMKSANVEVLKLPSGQEGYVQTNLDLLNRAQALAKELGTGMVALVIWNEQARGADDVTAHFLEQARQRKMPVTEISTL
jgi:hypothetical protein